MGGLQAFAAPHAKWRTASSRAWGTFRDPRRAGPGNCASCGLRTFYVHGTRRATRDAHAGTRMRVAMVRSCRRSHAGVCSPAMPTRPPMRPHCHAYYTGASVSREALKFEKLTPQVRDVLDYKFPTRLISKDMGPKSGVYKHHNQYPHFVRESDPPEPAWTFFMVRASRVWWDKGDAGKIHANECFHSTTARPFPGDAAQGALEGKTIELQGCPLMLSHLRTRLMVKFLEAGYLLTMSIAMTRSNFKTHSCVGCNKCVSPSGVHACNADLTYVAAKSCSLPLTSAASQRADDGKVTSCKCAATSLKRSW